MVVRLLLLTASMLAAACGPVHRDSDAPLPVTAEDNSALQQKPDVQSRGIAVVPSFDELPGRFFTLIQPVGDDALTPAGVPCVSAHLVAEVPLPVGSTLEEHAHVVYEGTPTSRAHLSRLLDIEESVDEIRLHGDVPATLLNDLRLHSVRYLRFNNVRPTNLTNTFNLNVERFPRLVHAAFYNCHALSDDLWQEVADHAGLLGVTVVNCSSVTGRGVSAAAGLSELTLDVPHVDEGVAAELVLLAGLSRLQIRIRNNADFDSLNRLASLPNLYGLDLRATDAALKAVSNFHGLMSLRLVVGDSTSDEGIAHLYTVATLNEVWLDGSLSASLLTDKTLQTLASLPNLRGLCLMRGTYSETGFGHLEVSGKLVSLVLYEVALTEASLSSIARLKGLRHLELLHSPRENHRALLELAAASGLQYLKVRAGTDASENATLSSLRERLPNLTISQEP